MKYCLSTCPAVYDRVLPDWRRRASLFHTRRIGYDRRSRCLMRIVRHSILFRASLFLLPLLVSQGCTQTRVVTIRTKPVGAIVRIETEEKGTAPTVGEKGPSPI